MIKYIYKKKCNIVWLFIIENFCQEALILSNNVKLKQLELFPFSCILYIMCCNKIKNKKYHTIRTILKSEVKIIERG